MLVATEHLSASNPVFIEIGIAPSDLAPFGVTIVAGHAYAATATNQVMLGWRAASNFGLRVGSRFHANGTWNTVTGIYSTGNSFGDSGAMFPLSAIQGYNRLPGIVTMAFVKVTKGVAAAHRGPPDRRQHARAHHHSHRLPVRTGRPEPRLPQSRRDREHGAGRADRCGHRRQHHAACPCSNGPASSGSCGPSDGPVDAW